MTPEADGVEPESSGPQQGGGRCGRRDGWALDGGSQDSGKSRI